MLTRTAQENPQSAKMIQRAKRALVVLALVVFAFATLTGVRVTNLFGSHGINQRTSFRLGGEQAKIRKVLERDKLLQAESGEMKERDLDAERRWGIGDKDEHRPDLAVKKQVNAKVITLKDRPVTDEVNFREYEKNITDWTWRLSRRNITSFRNELRAARVDVQRRFLTSNATHKVGSKVTAYLSRNNVTFTSTFARYQPEVSPFLGITFKKCSVVGNSGLLMNSACGPAIDSADYVFRINVPEMDPYIEDVGYKTNFTTLNPSIFKRKYNYFANTQLTDKFNKDVSQFQGLLMLPCFSDDAWVPICNRALLRLTPKESLGVAFGDPDQFSLIRDYWATKGLSKYPSTGLYLATAAIALCDELHLYGFWPFLDSSMAHVTTHPVKYHYFDNTHMVRVHDMHSEFELLTRLHKAGVLRLHIEACSPAFRRHTGRSEVGDMQAADGTRHEPVDDPQNRIDIGKLWEKL